MSSVFARACVLPRCSLTTAPLHQTALRPSNAFPCYTQDTWAVHQCYHPCIDRSLFDGMPLFLGLFGICLIYTMWFQEKVLVPLCTLLQLSWAVWWSYRSSNQPISADHPWSCGQVFPSPFPRADHSTLWLLVCFTCLKFEEFEVCWHMVVMGCHVIFSGYCVCIYHLSVITIIILHSLSLHGLFRPAREVSCWSLHINQWKATAGSSNGWVEVWPVYC